MGSPVDLSSFSQSAFVTPTGMAVAALLLLRITGLMWIAPVFSGRAIPGSIRTAITVVLTVLLFPGANASEWATLAHVDIGTVLAELCVGLTLGLGAAIFVAAAEAAGDMLAVQMGLSGANVVDPMSQTQLPVIGQLLGMFATVLIVSAGGHLVILSALHRSLEVLPLGAPMHMQEGAMAVVKLGSVMLSLGLQFAAPVVAAMMMANAALGVLARTVPQLNVLMVAFPVQIAVGLFVLSATLPLMATSFTAWPDRYTEIASTLLRTFAVGGGR